VNVTGSVLLGNYEPRADMSDDRRAGKHQPHFLGHIRGAAHLGVLAALGEAALRDCLLEPPGVESGGGSRRATCGDSETRRDEDACH
jgi:hypothetical protein